MYDLVSIGKDAQEASRTLRISSTATRNEALSKIASALRESRREIVDANNLDVDTARIAGVRSAMIDRLTLDYARLEDVAQAVEALITLPDPVGVVEHGSVLYNGMQVLKTKVPFGVIAMIYEARPNVTVDAATLCLKSGNACILRGGSDAFATSRVLVGVMRKAIEEVGLPANCICLVEDTSHETATRLMKLTKYVDLLIPRGGATLIRSVVENATVPVIETGIGNCHLYVDKDADLEMAVRIADNAKASRPSVCNSIETLLVHEAVAEKFLPMVKKPLELHHVQLRGCHQTRAIIKTESLATEEDYATEFSDYILAIKVVSDIGEAIEHITKYSTGHSEAIITNNLATSRRFTAEVDAAAVYVNASTRFTDGGMFGMGAEIGIATQKLHSRGPMGLNEMTCIKYIISGDGQIR